jgi:hypothetical protein
MATLPNRRTIVQREALICSGIIIGFMLVPMGLRAQIVNLCDRSASTTVMGDEYNVMNNVWGSGAGVGDQCLEVDASSSYFKVSLSTHNSGNVAAYPAIFKGCHWGWCTAKDNPMPVPVWEIGSAPFTWAIRTDSASGTWNSALDIWFDDASSFNNDYDAEMMIWIDYNGGATPAGSRQATVQIGGLTWDVYFTMFADWAYVAYKITSPVDSVSLDLRDFIHDSIIRGYLYTPWYMHAIEAGFEIWRGGQSLTTRSFSADVVRTTSPVNYAPLSFGLQSPSNNGTVDSLVVTFRWQQAVDPDLDPVGYILCLSGPGTDTTIAGLDTTLFVFDGSKSLEGNTTYTWYVKATDGFDTTVSSSQRTFKTPPTVGVERIDPIPHKFFLHQNYPNPFNTSTEIIFEIEMATELDLSVFNVLGERVKTLTSGFYQPGRYQATFDASGLPSGVYYYQLKTPSQHEKRSCVYLK